MTGFTILLGGEGMPGGGEEDEDRAAAKEAVKRFREAKNDEVALEAFLALCRYAKQAHDDEGMGDDDEGGEGY